jgi:hypothetical protein
MRQIHADKQLMLLTELSLLMVGTLYDITNEQLLAGMAGSFAARCALLAVSRSWLLCLTMFGFFSVLVCQASLWCIEKICKSCLLDCFVYPIMYILLRMYFDSCDRIKDGALYCRPNLRAFISVAAR